MIDSKEPAAASEPARPNGRRCAKCDYPIRPGRACYYDVPRRGYICIRCADDVLWHFHRYLRVPPEVP